jgi:2,5-diamino-6-(ribosylamino)-4(3H)-pyrimidinone 5'-phosphate reductase
MSVDGRLALATREQTTISGPEDVARVHRLRAASDAILVGIGTVLSDDPKLTVKWDVAGIPEGSHPLRVIVDGSGRTPQTASVLRQTGMTLIATSKDCSETWPNTEVFRAGEDCVDLIALLEELDRRGVRTLMVEGGSGIIGAFLRARLADELKVFVGSLAIGDSGAPALADMPGVFRLEDTVTLTLENMSRLNGGVLLEYQVVR